MLVTSLRSAAPICLADRVCCTVCPPACVSGIAGVSHGLLQGETGYMPGASVQSVPFKQVACLCTATVHSAHRLVFPVSHMRTALFGWAKVFGWATVENRTELSHCSIPGAQHSHRRTHTTPPPESQLLRGSHACSCNACSCCCNTRTGAGWGGQHALELQWHALPVLSEQQRIHRLARSVCILSAPVNSRGLFALTLARQVLGC